MGSRAHPLPRPATAPSLLRPLRLGRLDDRRLAQLAATGDERAFEVLYDRHHRALLGFCRHMLRSREEAEDALQQTFLRAHRALATHGPPTDPRPWLYTIARNHCRTLLSSRRHEVSDETRFGSTEGLGEQVQKRADLRAVVADVEHLPDDQRAALVLAELADLSHEEIADVIGVRTAKVKALIFQARSTLIAERDARDTPCETIREQLATAQGGVLRRGPLRRHLRVCAPCRAYRTAVSEQRSALALALPVTPSLGLKAGVLGGASAAGGAGAGAAAVGGASTVSLTGGFTAKLAAGALLVGGAGGGAAIVDRADPGPRSAPAAEAAAHPRAAPSTTPVAIAGGPQRSGARIGPPAERLATERPATERPATERLAAEPATERQAAGRTSTHHSARGRSHGRAVGRPTGGPPGQAKKPSYAAAPGRAKRPSRAKAVDNAAPAKPAHPVHPVKPLKPAKSVKGADRATPAPATPATPATPAERATPATSATPANAAKP